MANTEAPINLIALFIVKEMRKRFAAVSGGIVFTKYNVNISEFYYAVLK
jgi:hypothetical protein